MRARLVTRHLIFRTLLYYILRLKPSFTSSSLVLVLLVLAGSSITCRMSALMGGCPAPRDHDSHLGCVLVAKV